MASNLLSEQSISQRQSKIGVFICECGDEMAGTLNVETLVKTTEELQDVAFAGHAPYWCSADGRECLQETIRGEELERVIVAGCSPRTHRRLFQNAAADSGLSSNLVGLVNIREGCAWPHRQAREPATARAVDQIAMEVARLSTLAPSPAVEAEITPTALVIGGGVAGMTAALELANAKTPVTLVERTASLGGTAITQTPKLAADLTTAIQKHSGIIVELECRIAQVAGSVGEYYVTTTNHAIRSTQYGPFGAIIVATGAPDEETAKLAELLRLPQDADGFLPQLRVRLRPGSYIERGVYVCGSAHYPCEAAEAQFQAYSTAARALHYLRRGKVTAHGPMAQVTPELCNGCGDCVNVCPFFAVMMTERPSGISLSEIDTLLCTGCGNCVSICPVGAVTVADWSDTQLEAQIRVALSTTSCPAPSPQPRAIIFACEWSGYAAAELAGVQKLTYPSNVRMIRLDCAGRLQPGLILKAFELGAAGVLVLGCEPRLCHYERGNERAAAAYEQIESITRLLGLSPDRIQLAWTPPDDGPGFAELVTRFVEGAIGSNK